MDFKDKPYALAVIGITLALLTCGIVWVAAGRAKAPPPTVSAPALSPEQEAMRQAQGEAKLGANQGAASRDVGESRR